MGWMVRGSGPCWGAIFRSRPDRPRDPPSLLYKGYQAFRGVRGVKAAVSLVDLSPRLQVDWSFLCAFPLWLQRHVMGWPSKLLYRHVAHTVINIYQSKGRNTAKNFARCVDYCLNVTCDYGVLLMSGNTCAPKIWNVGTSSRTTGHCMQ